MSEGQRIVECPNCGSNKVKVNPLIKNILISAALIFIFIPVIGWITGPIMAAVAWSANKAAKKENIKAMKCEECKHSFRIPGEKYEEYETYLKAN
jgi:Zn finger protein HypA/HybF involved in hydrogenase expression